jgi:hypothetical protein
MKIGTAQELLAKVSHIMFEENLTNSTQALISFSFVKNA